MSIEAARVHSRMYGIEDRVLEFGVSGAAAELASCALRVHSARLSKTLSFKTEKGCMFIICAGDARIDNQKFSDHFYINAEILAPDEVNEMVGQPFGVFPFGKKEGGPVYLDESILRYDTVFHTSGSSSITELTVEELFKYSKAKGLVNVCLTPDEEAAD